MDTDLTRSVILAVSCLVLVFVIGILIYSQKRRTDVFRMIADAMGFSFAPKGDPAFLKRLEPLAFFSQGPGFGRRVRNLVRGRVEEGVEVALMDFSFHAPYQKGAVVRTAVLIEGERGELPGFTLSPKGLFGALQRGIDLGPYPDFAKRYLLRGREEGDEDAVRALLTPGLIGFFEDRAGVAVEGRGRQMVYYGASGQVSIGRLEFLLEDGLELYRLLRLTWQSKE